MTQGKKVVIVVSSIVMLIFLYFAVTNLKSAKKSVIVEESGAVAEIPQHIQGLKVELLQYGNGERQVRPGDYILIYYEGRLADGTVFFSNMSGSEPFGVYIGKGETLPGWDKGLIGMRINEKRKLILAPDMAYGDGGSPKDGVPANTDLIYEIHLVDIVE